MAKRKNRQPNLPEAALARARAELYGETEIASEQPQPEVKRKSKAVSKKAVTIEDLKEEYVYVTTDLRSMGLLAAVLFVGLIVASLIIV